MLAEVSTHSRPKAAGERYRKSPVDTDCFNTQPPEGGWAFKLFCSQQGCCFNTQPPEGGWKSDSGRGRLACCFNTQPPEGGWLGIPSPVTDFDVMFQHTAARRRLALALRRFAAVCTVSTHSRPKAAGAFAVGLYRQQFGFNTQPPEGGWVA